MTAVVLELVTRADLEILARGALPRAAARRALPGALLPAHAAIRALDRVACGAPQAWCSIFHVVDDAGRIVGSCGFKHHPRDGEVEIGYAIAPAARGLGIAGAAVGALLEIARNVPDVDTVVANVSPANEASTRLVRRHGFVAQGTFVDEHGDALVRWCRATPSPSGRHTPAA